ncbi:chaperonin 10-like protein [Podospora didyma]|uniref:Chaperonin 10-like protein n=1 Tax=Podospora didyma TaxID=330526 RepID=A0AAE0U0L7_9PEZI|nr:chaperonin 10-like protein [Podospora didyma]
MATDLASGFRSKAYVAYTAGGPITLEEVSYGPIAPDEIVVKTAATGICATDLKAAAGKFFCQPPMILGHESAGEVLAVGSAVHNLSPGDNVVLSYSSCGSCGSCVAGANAYCQELIHLNFTGSRPGGSVAAESTTTTPRQKLKGHFFGMSSMGDRIVARANCAVKLPPSTPPEELRLFASLGCGIQTGAGAIFNVAKPPPNSKILIFGAGSVGLTACLAAKLTSPSRLVVVDNRVEKLDMVPDYIRTAANLVNSSEFPDQDKLADGLRALTPASSGYDFVLDCVGRGDLVRVGHMVLKTRGMLIAVGGSQDMALQVPMRDHLTKGATFRGTHQGDSVPSTSIPLLIDLWRQGKFPFDELLTFYKFEDLDRALDDMKEGKVIKPVLVQM